MQNEFEYLPQNLSKILITRFLVFFLSFSSEFVQKLSACIECWSSQLYVKIWKILRKPKIVSKPKKQSANQKYKPEKQTKESKTFLVWGISVVLVAWIELKSWGNHISKIDTYLTEFTKEKAFEKFTVFIESQKWKLLF